MDIEVSTAEKGTIVSITGRMDAVSSPDVEKRLSEEIEKGATRIVIDLRELEYISSAGLRTILASAKKLKAAGGALGLSGLKDVVKEVFEISGFTAILPIYESADEALDAL